MTQPTASDPAITSTHPRPDEQEPRASRIALLLRDYGMILALAVIFVMFSLLTPGFFKTDNLINILDQVAVVGIVAVGMTFVILTGGIDLSVGSLLALTALISATFAVQAEQNIATVLLALLSPIIVGAIAGAFNGALVATGMITPFIVTLATYTAFRGLAVWFHVNPIYDLPDWYRFLGEGRLLGIPYGVFAYAFVVFLAFVTLNFTHFGRSVYAVGGNERASRASGIRTARVKFTVYVISGALVGLATLINNGRTGAAQSYSGTGLELQAIAAVVIGGVSLFGGRGKVWNAVVGTLVIGVLFNGLVLMNVSAPIQSVVIGAIIIGASLLDGFFRKRSS